MCLNAEVVVKRHDAVTIAEIVALQPQQIVISPGPFSPREAGISLAVIQEFAGQIPLLGICLGHQCIVHHFGGKIVRAAQPMHGKTSQLQHRGDDLFKNCLNPLQVMRYHSLLAEPESLPQELEVTAVTADAEIMAVRHMNLPIWGVQFHPESIKTACGLQLLENFLILSRGD